MNRYSWLVGILVMSAAFAIPGHAAQLIGGASGSCVNLPEHGGSAPTEGAQVIIVTCNGRPSQQWSISHGQIIGIGGKCLDVSGSGTADTTPLIIATCTASPSQQWSVQ